MTIVDLQISNLRNISSAKLSFHPRLNVVSGMNGSGKTSFLEALYLLGSGHSFRTREISALVSHERDKLTVFAKTNTSQRISIQKSIHFPTIAKLNGDPCLTRSELASFLPCQIFYQDIFQFIDAGPALRRGLLDWGLFHHEKSYHSLWKDYHRALKQRNSLLKQRATLQQLIPWNILLGEFANQLDVFRSSYFNQLSRKFSDILSQLSDLNCELHYYKGWDRKDEGKTLEEILYASYESDILRQFTYYGPHQADLSVISKDFKAKHYLSRGQQKIVLFALKFAQAQFVAKSCLFLIDDLSAELDEHHITQLMNYLLTIEGQFFITVRPSDIYLLNLPSNSYTHFLIEKGQFNATMLI